MCQSCFERQSRIFLALVPEMIEKAERILESEENILVRFMATGDPQGIARTVKTVADILEDLESLFCLDQVSMPEKEQALLSLIATSETVIKAIEVATLAFVDVQDFNGASGARNLFWKLNFSKERLEELPNSTFHQ